MKLRIFLPALDRADAATRLAWMLFDARGRRLGGERVQLEAKREAIFRAAFPEARVVVDPELQMARNLADLQRSHGLLSGDDFMAQLTRAARQSGGRVQSIEYRNGRLDIHRDAGLAEAAR